MDREHCYFCEHVSLRGCMHCKCYKVYRPKGGRCFKDIADVSESECQFQQISDHIPEKVREYFTYMDGKVNRGIISEHMVYVQKLCLYQAIQLGLTFEDMIKMPYEEILEIMGVTKMQKSRSTQQYTFHSFRQFIGVEI